MYMNRILEILFYFNPHLSFISSRYVLLSKLTILQHRGFKSFLFGSAAGGIYCLAFKVRGDPERIMMSVSVNLRSNCTVYKDLFIRIRTKTVVIFLLSGSNFYY